MMERMLITGPGFCCCVENGLLTEYIQEDASQQYGDIVGGRVERLMPGIGCAFVNIGRKKDGFLPLDEMSRSFEGEKLKSGVFIPVQIRKEETGNKGAFLTRDLTLAGRTVLLMPLNRHIGISSRITDEEERKRLRETGEEIADGETGLVLRTAAREAGTEEIAEEVRSLAEEWQRIREQIRTGFKAGEVLFHQDPVKQMIRDYESMGIQGRKETEALSAEMQRQLRESESRMVRIPNGGNIVIDRCEAMTVIDVNSASSGIKGKPEASYTEINLAACETIAAQIRLRNLAGIIMIDFIDMKEEADRQKVAEKLAEVMKRDRRKTVIHGWTRLGIMEMTRKRTGG
jgi:ribonuclease G